MNKTFFKSGILPISLLIAAPAFSATPVDLSKQPVSALTALLSADTLASSPEKMEEVSRGTDFNQTLHVRMRETYKGYPVWGADTAVHIPKGGRSRTALTGLITPDTNMNGKIYHHLDVDLANTPAYVFNEAQAQKAVQAAVAQHQQEVGAKSQTRDSRNRLMVYVDKNNKAHWAFQVSFYAAPVKEKAMPEKPVYILDAVSFQTYKHWNDIKTLDNVSGGGYGGNKKMGILVYDGLNNHLPALSMLRDPQTKTCYLQNGHVTVKRCTEFNNSYQMCMQSVNFAVPCKGVDAQHGNVYWNGESDAVHGAYSPSNDALYAGAVIKDMYMTWYDLPVLVKDGKPMMLNMVVHAGNMDNAYWDGEQMVFGDGYMTCYPLTSIGVGAHEISHGFTEQHAGLVYDAQSGGMNESFSDMAAQATEYFAQGSNNWKIGAEIMWWGDALRYMDKPSKDCGWWPSKGSCSIDHAGDYFEGLDVHFSSGVYNRAFYLMSTSLNWNTRKAFDVMVQANRFYWTSDTTFNEGACGVIEAAKDYGYDTQTVTKAFATVMVDTSQC